MKTQILFLIPFLIHVAARADPRVQELQREGNGLKVIPHYESGCYYLVRYSARLNESVSSWNAHHITRSSADYKRFFQEDSRQGFYVVEERDVNNPGDEDGDGIDDLSEMDNGSNPLNRDSDGDGIKDNEDANPLDPNFYATFSQFSTNTAGAGKVATVGGGTLPPGLWRIAGLQVGGIPYVVGGGSANENHVDNALVLTSGGKNYGLLHRFDGYGIYGGAPYTGEVLSGSYSVGVYEAQSDTPAATGAGLIAFAPLGAAEVVIRTFIPSAYVEAPVGFPVPGDWAVVGGLSNDIVFKGDNRTFDYASQSYRTEHRFLLMPYQEGDADGLIEESKDIGTTYTYQKSSSVIGSQLREEALADQNRFAPFMVDFDTASESDLDFEVERVNARTVKLRATCASGNPLFSELVVPDIDYDFTLTIDSSPQGYLWCTVQGCHDEFPSYEIFVNGRLVFGGAAKGSLVNLHGGVYLGFCVGADQVGSYGVWAPTTPPKIEP